MLKTSNRAKRTQAAVPDTCFVCNTMPMTDGNICKPCTKRLKGICTNKEDEIDTVLAAAIKKGRAKDRGISVRQAVRRLCSSCTTQRKTCQDLRKANRALKDRVRNFKPA